MRYSAGRCTRQPEKHIYGGGVRKKAMGRKLLGRTYDALPKRVQHATVPAPLRLRHALEIESGTLLRLGTM